MKLLILLAFMAGAEMAADIATGSIYAPKFNIDIGKTIIDSVVKFSDVELDIYYKEVYFDNDTIYRKQRYEVGQCLNDDETAWKKLPLQNREIIPCPKFEYFEYKESK